MAALIGAVLIAVILWEGFETVILPRRVTRRFRLSRYFYLLSWQSWKVISHVFVSRKRQETWLSFFGPLSIIFMLGIWIGGLIVGFALIYGVDNSFIPIAPAGRYNFVAFLYFSGSTFFTLGLGDVLPRTDIARLLTVLESGMGFGFLALLFSYLPALNQSFARREANILLLDARAGSPPCAAEMLRRHSNEHGREALQRLLEEWEHWTAEFLEGHLSYPVLAYFRSQHDNVSWLSSLTAVLDTCALIIAGVECSCERQARLTFAVARHAVVDLCLVFQIAPQEPSYDRLPDETRTKLRAILAEAGLKVQTEGGADVKLTELRNMYEPYVHALAAFFYINLPPWVHESEKLDNWQTSAWEPRVKASLRRWRKISAPKRDHW